jgi:hypothetical protein
MIIAELKHLLESQNRESIEEEGKYSCPDYIDDGQDKGTERSIPNA